MEHGLGLVTTLKTTIFHGMLTEADSVFRAYSCSHLHIHSL